MTMKSCVTHVLSCVVCLVAWFPCAAEETQPFRFYKEMTVEEREQEELVEVTLDRDIYAETQAKLADIRITDDQGNEVPYVIEKVVEKGTKTARQSWHARNISLAQGNDESLEISIRLDDDDPSTDGIRLVTPLFNFEQRVSVSGSNDGDSWEVLVAEAVVFDYSRYMDVSNREIVLPANTFRHFRIKIDNVTAEQESRLLELTRRLRGNSEDERTEKITIERRPFRVDRIEFWHNVTQDRVRGDKKAEYAITAFEVEEDPDEQTTRVRVETLGEPLTSLTIETKSRNFSRRAIVRVPRTSGVRTRWVEVGQATITRIDLPDLKREKLTISFSEQRGSEFEIAIENRDSPPLEITGISAEGNVYRLLFFATPGQTYQLHYGSDTAERPDYDTVALCAALKSNDRPSAVILGDQLAADPSATNPGVALGRLLKNPVAYGVVIVLLVVALAWGLFRATRRLDQMSTED